MRVPSTALIVDSEGTRIAALTSGNRIDLRPVKLGRDFGQETEILQGLKEGESVVVSPSDSLTSGLQVSPQEPKDTGNSTK
jgi:multidrug efflux pump subunit AcrA (membrane-fusion protein)